MQNKTTGDAYRKNKKNKTHFLSGVSTLLDSRGRFVFWSNVQESKEKKESSLLDSARGDVHQPLLPLCLAFHSFCSFLSFLPGPKDKR